MLMMYVFSAAIPIAWWARLRLAGGDATKAGANATEYAVLIGFIAVAVAGSIAVLGMRLTTAM